MLVPIRQKDGRKPVRWLNVAHIVSIGPIDTKGGRAKWAHVDAEGGKRPYTDDELAQTMSVDMTHGEGFTGNIHHRSFRMLLCWAFIFRWGPVIAIVAALLAAAASFASWANSGHDGNGRTPPCHHVSVAIDNGAPSRANQ